MRKPTGASVLQISLDRKGPLNSPTGHNSISTSLVFLAYKDSFRVEKTDYLYQPQSLN